MFDELREMIKKWKESPHVKEHSDESRFVLIALLKEGPLTLKELEEKSFLFVSQFGLENYRHTASRHHREEFNITTEIDRLMKDNMIVQTHEKYELTNKGKKMAVESAEMIEKGAQWIKKNVLNPSAAARNTVIADFFLAVMKLVVGLISGSVGLLADGADAAVDTVSASIVWVGMKMKRELIGTMVIIAMMGVTGVSIGYESVTKIIDVIYGTVEPMSKPYLVIGVEGIALLVAVFLCLYQGFVGKKYGSLALISQSIDSKNHIYVAAVVIVGAVFSIFGIYFVDAVIGVYISFKILKDGFGLSKEVISSARGEKIDFSKFELLFEKHWRMSTHDSFRFWVLYTLRECSLEKNELTTELEKTFKHTYIPILSEFEFTAAEGFDFEEGFDRLVQPLLDENMVTKRDATFTITKRGRQYVDSTLRSMRYHQIK
ncbi:MAG: cation diffusion facilitator family transporter [Theionarchaea archaeon]|nr:cation diffusion facilitator family transporter [Theionarchaea archaeon]